MKAEPCRYSICGFRVDRLIIKYERLQHG
jgi:hypothetical protein